MKNKNYGRDGLDEIVDTIFIILSYTSDNIIELIHRHRYNLHANHTATTYILTRSNINC